LPMGMRLPMRSTSGHVTTTASAAYPAGRHNHRNRVRDADV
jgi:hypothetical protein